ncbi:MAG: hypothetical protein Athens071426_307, partial [Parcubacteria group bacterium Athens0714_26]
WRYDLNYKMDMKNDEAPFHFSCSKCGAMIHILVKGLVDSIMMNEIACLKCGAIDHWYRSKNNQERIAVSVNNWRHWRYDLNYKMDMKNDEYPYNFKCLHCGGDIYVLIKKGEGSQLDTQETAICPRCNRMARVRKYTVSGGFAFGRGEIADSGPYEEFIPY